MKRLFAAALCALAICGLLAGCGKTKPKEVPPYFPHNDTLRLDASVDEAIKADGLVHQKDLDGNELEFDYEKIELVSIDNKQFKIFCGPNKFDEMTYIYLMSSGEGKDFSQEYEQLVQYFAKIYGESEDSVPSHSESDSFFTIISAQTWKLTIDSGTEYSIEVSLSKSVNSPDSFLNIGVARTGA